MVKYTKGEWKVGYKALSVEAKNPYGKGDFKVCDIRGWGHLTGCGAGALGLEHDEAEEIQKANAKLIAQAPAMYEALEKIIKFANSSEVPLSTGLAIHVTRAKKILQLAGGNDE